MSPTSGSLSSPVMNKAHLVFFEAVIRPNYSLNEAIFEELYLTIYKSKFLNILKVPKNSSFCKMMVTTRMVTPCEHHGFRPVVYFFRQIK